MSPRRPRLEAHQNIREFVNNTHESGINFLGLTPPVPASLASAGVPLITKLVHRFAFLEADADHAGPDAPVVNSSRRQRGYGVSSPVATHTDFWTLLTFVGSFRVETEHLVARTFFSVPSCRACLSTFDFHTRMRVAQDVHTSCVVISRTQKSSHLTARFHKTLLGVPDTFSSFCFSPPQTTPTFRPLTGIRSTPCATSPRGCMAEPHPHTVRVLRVLGSALRCGSL